MVVEKTNEFYVKAYDWYKNNFSELIDKIEREINNECFESE